MNSFKLIGLRLAHGIALIRSGKMWCKCRQGAARDIPGRYSLFRLLVDSYKVSCWSAILAKDGIFVWEKLGHHNTSINSVYRSTSRLVDKARKC